MLKTLRAVSALCCLLPLGAQTDRGVVAVYSSGIVVVGTTQQYLVYVGDIVPTTVTWSVNDIDGGNSVIGTISATGLYTAPPVAPTPNVVTIKATSTVKTSKFGTAQATVQQPTPWVWSVNPNSVTPGPITLSIGGANFVPSAVVRFGGVPLTTTYVSSTSLTATGTATTAQIGSVNVTVANPDPGGVVSQPKAVTVKAGSTGQISVTVTPSPASVPLGGSQQFTATVKNTQNTSVTWYVNDAPGGNATVGTVSATGLYQAPSTMPGSSTVKVRAVSVAAGSIYGSASVTLTANTVTPPAITSVIPSPIPVGPFTITVNGSGFVSGSKVSFGGAAIATSYVSAAQLTATGTATMAQVGSVAIVVTNPSPGGASAPFNISVTGSGPAPPQITSITPNPLPPGPFTLTINGTGFIAGAQATFGGSPLATLFLSGMQLTATGATTSAQQGTNVGVVVTNPGGPASASFSLPVSGGNNLVSYSVAARFLEQAAFGPTPAAIAHVQQVGLQGYLNEQFTTPPCPLPDPNVNPSAAGPMQVRFFTNAVNGPDQLRQRVSFALSQIFVISIEKLFYQQKMIPYFNMLANDAFGNYFQLMNDVTLSPAMGEFLDMVNNDKANPALGTVANENYARELMQLFTIGTYMLNPDGTLQLDGLGNPIFTYNHPIIADFARVNTGWTYPTQPGDTPQMHNHLYYFGPMVAYEPNHDNGSKTLLNGQVLPAGQTAAKDMNDALTNIFNHSNVGPFVSKLLIQHLVTSNPSPAYVQRVAAVFADNGSKVRGDLRAVVNAILMDTEARQGDGPSASPPTGGHLREPVFYMIGLLRALGATVDDTNSLTYDAYLLGQSIYNPDSVFNYFSPSYAIPGTSLLGPEFQLQTPSDSLGRDNWADYILSGKYASNTQAYGIDLASFVNLASNPAQLVDAVDAALTCGQMPAQMKNYIINAVSGTQGNLTRAQTALYLTAASSFYQVQH